jgi:tetratricopeptide (TPR) repeat protein
LLSEAIARKPDYALAFNARGYAYFMTGKARLAVADYTRAIEINPAYVNAYQNRAGARRSLGDTAGANEDLAKAASFSQQ